jgi:hypothetical protein
MNHTFQFHTTLPSPDHFRTVSRRLRRRAPTLPARPFRRLPSRIPCWVTRGKNSVVWHARLSLLRRRGNHQTASTRLPEQQVCPSTQPSTHAFMLQRERVEGSKFAPVASPRTNAR